MNKIIILKKSFNGIGTPRSMLFVWCNFPTELWITLGLETGESNGLDVSVKGLSICFCV